LCEPLSAEAAKKSEKNERFSIPSIGSNSRLTVMAQSCPYLPIDDIVEPADETSLATFIAESAGKGNAIYPVGGQTFMALGAPGTRPGYGVRLDRLRSLVDYPAEDLTVTVQSGMRICELDALLRENNQRLPVDIPQPSRATVGGAIAVNWPGPRQVRYGTLRDYVLGMRVVDGRGNRIFTGARVVKNAAGYNLHRLYIGSLGTLGVVTEVTLMVRPRPPVHELLVFPIANLQLAAQAVERFFETPYQPSVLAVLVGRRWRAESGDLPSLSSSAPMWLAVGFEGREGEVRAALEAVKRSFPAEVLREHASFSNEVADKFAQTIADFPTAYQARSEGESDELSGNGKVPILLRADLLPTDTLNYAERISQLVPETNMLVLVGSGVVQAWISIPEHALGDRVDKEFGHATRELSGSLIVGYYPAGTRLSRSTIWGLTGGNTSDVRRLMAHQIARRIKEQFDPQNVLNPGRYIFD